MTREEAIAVIGKSPLAQHKQELVAHLLPSVRITAERYAQGQTTKISRFGGLPLLAPDANWPHWDAGSFPEMGAVRGPRPLAFIGQIDLAAIGTHGVIPGLPHEGLLSFFYDAETCPGSFDPLARGCGQVIYSRGKVVEREPPESTANELRFSQCTLKFEEQWVLPDYMTLV